MTLSGKLVVLKFDGSLQQGFRVLLEISHEGDRPSVELTGSLPPNPEIVASLSKWQQHYRSLNINELTKSRIQPQQIIYGGSVNRLTDCWQSATDLYQQMAAWLASPSFRPLDLRIRERLSITEPIRVLIRTKDPLLRRLPWHLWDFIERYAKTEIALSAPVSERVVVESPAVTTRSVKILALLGNSEDIDIRTDSQFISALPDADITFLTEPSRQELNQHLWKQPWDILFFAGHSSTEDDRGLVCINANESLSLEELKYALKQAISKGLQLAIFNSCDGLGLAQSLESLHLPQMIVMREPVPDQVAQTFLKYFLQAFSSGKSLYLSMREAREQLQSMEDRFPCATWLPIICQNSAELPPTWQGLAEGRTKTPAPLASSHAATVDKSGLRASNNPGITPQNKSRSQPHFLQQLAHRLRQSQIVFLVGLAVTAGLLSPFSLNQMQPLELGVYDFMMQQRPDEGPDSRLLIIEITDDDIAAQKARGEPLERQSISAQSYGQTFETSLSDQSFNQLLEKLAQYQPRTIGVDLYRDFAVAAEQGNLASKLKNNAEIVAVCKAEDFEEASIPSIDPPPEVPIDRVGFSDFREDSDGILRRHLLGMLPLVRTQDSRCNTDWSFSLKVAAQYLAQQQVETSFTEAGDIRIENQTIGVLRSHSGSYPPDVGGSEILLNYRATEEIAPRVTLQQFLTQQTNPDYLKDKIVLIGATLQDGEDTWVTPTQLEGGVAGVVVQAHMVSQLLSAALDARPMIKMLSPLQQTGLILTWAIVGGCLSRWQRTKKSKFRTVFQHVVKVIAAGIFLYGFCFFSLIRGHWLPLFSLLFALLLSNGLMTIFLFIRSGTKSASSPL
ncbi:MAG: CHASE2 domain-containing protein [Phormidesmis sp.]